MGNLGEKTGLNELEQVRQKIHEAVCAEWRETAPAAVQEGVPPSRVMASIAAKHGMTAQYAAVVLRKAGLYEGAKAFKNQVNQEAQQ